MSLLENYDMTLISMGVLAGWMILQLLLVDVVSILRKHPPGTPVETGHGDFLFRAVRTHANTNESIAVFILAALFGIFSGASPVWLNGFACAFASLRILYSLCYYTNAKLLRSTVFGLAIVSLIGMVAIGSAAWI